MIKGGYIMQCNNNYNYTIKEKDLLRILKEYEKRGGEPLVILNGEFYNIQFESAKMDTKTA